MIYTLNTIYELYVYIKILTILTYSYMRIMNNYVEKWQYYYGIDLSIYSKPSI